MNQTNKIEAYYLKLIGVTLLMTAACVSDSGTKKSLTIVDDNVREIILEQFHFLSTAHWNEVIDWENAIKDASELPFQQRRLNDFTYFEVVECDQTLPTFTIGLGLSPTSVNDEVFIALQEKSFKSEPIISSIERNKHALSTRAGPLV